MDPPVRCSLPLDRWQHLAGDAESREGKAAHVQVNTDTNLFVTELSRGKQVQFEAKEGRKAYVVCLEGSAALRGGKDGARGGEAALHGGSCESPGRSD